MSQPDTGLVVRIGEISRKLGAVNQAVGNVLVAARPRAIDLRVFSYELVNLGGDLTSFGVELASRADELGDDDDRPA